MIGNHRVAQHVSDAYLSLAQALGTRGAHVVLVHHVEHVGPQHPAVYPDEQHREREPGQDEVIRPVQRTLGERHVTARREQFDLEAEVVQQHRRQPEHRHRNAHQGQDCQGAIGEPACVHGAQVAEHHRQRHPQHRRPDAQRERGGHAFPDLLDDVAVLGIRHELAGEDLLHHRQVLHDQGLVEPEIGADPGDRAQGRRSCPAIRAAGSEFGMTLKIRNTITEIANSTAIMPSRRLATNRAIA